MSILDYIPGVSLFKNAPEHLGNSFDKLGNWLSGKWDDYTGLNLAKYQQQMQEEMYEKYQSPAAMMRQFKEAGLNPNLVYGSASAGIGHAPSFDASHVMRGSEKVNSVLSALSSVLGVKQAIYQTDVAREAAQQAAIRTADDSVRYRSNAMDYVFKSDLYGADINNFRDKNPIFFSRSGDTYSRYLGEYRASKFNEWIRKGLENQYDFGGSSDYFGNLQLRDMKTVPYFDTRNRMSRLRYTLLDEIGNTGTYGKLVISLLDLLK